MLHQAVAEDYRRHKLIFGRQVQAAADQVHNQAEREATYQAALKLAARIDADLTRGIRHYRNKAGLLLTTLDEVVRAIIDEDLLLPEEQSHLPEAI